VANPLRDDEDLTISGRSGETGVRLRPLLGTMRTPHGKAAGHQAQKRPRQAPFCSEPPVVQKTREVCCKIMIQSLREPRVGYLAQLAGRRGKRLVLASTSDRTVTVEGQWA